MRLHWFEIYGVFHLGVTVECALSNWKGAHAPAESLAVDVVLLGFIGIGACLRRLHGTTAP